MKGESFNWSRGEQLNDPPHHLAYEGGEAARLTSSFADRG
jgi:hypothetical protein